MVEWEDILKELWKSWNVCHRGMVEVTDKRGYCGDGQSLDGMCDELMRMMMWIVENVKVKEDDEVNGIIGMLVGLNEEN